MEDHDILIEIKARLETLQKSFNERLSHVEKRLDNHIAHLQRYCYVLLGTTLAFILKILWETIH